MKQKYKKILKQVQNDEVRDCHAIARNDGESGRSMVEMLGVLAVIGVLSVAGIVGYSIAMRSYRTNEIVNAASMLYIMAQAQNAGNGPTGKVAYTDIEKTNPSGVSSLEYENNAITITFNDPKDCTMALNKLGDKASGECPSLTISFDSDSSEKNEDNLVDCSTFTPDTCNLSCNNGRISYAPEGTSCDSYNVKACDGVGKCNSCPSYSFATLGSSDVNTSSNGKTNIPGCSCTSYGPPGKPYIWTGTNCIAEE